MSNESNLTPFTSEQSREEAMVNGQKGGVASGKARRNKKTLAALLQRLMDAIPPNVDELATLYPDISYEDLNNRFVLAVGLWKKAEKGDVRATRLIVELIDENKPINRECNCRQKQPTIEEIKKVFEVLRTTDLKELSRLMDDDDTTELYECPSS